MHRYQLYGLTLQADRALPGLPPASGGQADIRFEFDPPGEGASIPRNGPNGPILTSPYEDELGRPQVTIWRLSEAGGYRFRYADGAEFAIDPGGRRVAVSSPGDLPLEDVLAHLLGQISATALMMRGITCLHASAAEVDGRVVALAGPSGRGKSTLAAALACGGARILCDDVLALDDRADGFFAQPAYARLRLWPDAVEGLFGSGHALPGSPSAGGKRYHDLEAGDGFREQPAPLAAIYVIKPPPGPSAHSSTFELPASEGLMSLVANSYSFPLLDVDGRRRDFESLSRVVAGVAVRRLVPATRWDALRRLAETIRADLAVGSREPARV